VRTAVSVADRIRENDRRIPADPQGTAFRVGAEKSPIIPLTERWRRVMIS
jgi:hypothetical protein